MIKSDLENILEYIPENKKAIARELVEELWFQHNTLNALKQHVTKKGVVTLWNGQERENPALKSYTQLQKNYNNTAGALLRLIPDSAEVKNPVLEFMTQ